MLGCNLELSTPPATGLGHAIANAAARNEAFSIRIMLFVQVTKERGDASCDMNWPRELNLLPANGQVAFLTDGWAHSRSYQLSKNVLVNWLSVTSNGASLKIFW